VGKISYDGNKWIQKGFFITLCYFIDELLEECRAEFEKTYGAIVWGFVEPIGEKKILDFNQVQNNLREMVALLPASAAAAAAALHTEIHNLKTDNVDADVKKIRGDLDNALIVEIRKIVEDDGKLTSVAKGYDEPAFKAAKLNVEKWNAALSPDGIKKLEAIDSGKLKASVDKASGTKWVWKASSQSEILADGECGYSAPKKDSSGRNYRKSPQFRAMKKGLEDGSISKKEYKKGKKELKRILG
jgi:hypothetical protein